MFQQSDGMNYAPKGKPNPVVKDGAFKFAAVHLDHGHIFGMCNGLTEAGATLSKIYEPDSETCARLSQQHPQAQVVDSLEAVLEDPEIALVAAAAIPNLRGPLGCRVMQAGKDYFTDKCPFTTLDQLAEAKRVCIETEQKYMVYFSERLHNEASVFVGDLVEQGAIGKVVQVIGMGPHRLNASSRPDWFYKKEQYGGIITDIGSHQVEQFLYYTGAEDAKVLHAAVANYDNAAYPELEDFGQWTLVGDNGAMGYHRVDWFTPDGARTWGDGRLFLLGTEGYIEVRKNIDLGHDNGANHIFLVDQQGEQRFAVEGQVGFPYFGQLILDCINRTEHAMRQSHCFLAAQLSLQAQEMALQVATEGGRPLDLSSIS